MKLPFVKMVLRNVRERNSFSVIHLNIRSMKKHFEAFQDFIESSNFKFSAICPSQTWLQPHKISDSNFQRPGYHSFHLTGEKNRGGGLCIFCRKAIHTNSPNSDHKELENYFIISLS